MDNLVDLLIRCACPAEQNAFIGAACRSLRDECGASSVAFVYAGGAESVVVPEEASAPLDCLLNSGLIESCTDACCFRRGSVICREVERILVSCSDLQSSG